MGNLSYPPVEIIVLNWNGKNDTLACLASIEKLGYPVYHVTVVDNGSIDGSVEAIHAQYPGCLWLTVVENRENLGYTGGNNVGMRYALDQGADYIWLLNNDTLIEPYCLDILIRTAEENPSAGVLGPKVLCYPDMHLLYSRGESHNLWFNLRTVNIGEVDKNDDVVPREVDYVVGCSMLVRRKFVEHVGLLDETFFAYFEEVDWCFRGRKLGFDVLYVPTAMVYHKGGTSTGGMFSPTVLYYHTRNWIYFMRKHAAFYHWFTFVPLFIYVFMRRLLRTMWRRDIAGVKALLQAVIWNLRVS